MIRLEKAHAAAEKKQKTGAKRNSQGVDVSRETASGTRETYMVEMELTATTGHTGSMS